MSDPKKRKAASSRADHTEARDVTRFKKIAALISDSSHQTYFAAWVCREGNMHGVAPSYLRDFLVDEKKGAKQLLEQGALWDDKEVSKAAILSIFRGPEDAFGKSLLGPEACRKLLRSLGYLKLCGVWQGKGKEGQTVPDHMVALKDAYIALDLGETATGQGGSFRKNDGKFAGMGFNKAAVMNVASWKRDSTDPMPSGDGHRILKLDELLQIKGRDICTMRSDELVACLGIALQWVDPGMCLAEGGWAIQEYHFSFPVFGCEYV